MLRAVVAFASTHTPFRTLLFFFPLFLLMPPNFQLLAPSSSFTASSPTPPPPGTLSTLANVLLGQAKSRSFGKLHNAC